MEATEDGNRVGTTALLSPCELKARLPLGERAAGNVERSRRAIRDLLHGRDRRRLLMVVGPCSIHDPGAALDYARRLARIAEATSDVLLVVMRTYFEKPRTTVGWKGLINDPSLDGSCDVAAGLELARRLLLEINDLGLACATEVLDPIAPRYLADLVSWAAIGARTSESQTHRETASSLPMPVGFKNGTDGGVERALHAMIAARHPHRFIGVGDDGATSLVQTSGNPDRHVILRGGASGPNYSAEHVSRASSLVAAEGIARPIMVDCSHDNSGRDPAAQSKVCGAVLSQFLRGQEAILGMQVESHLHPGRQSWAAGGPLAYGVSITDACIGWEETERLLRDSAQAVRDRFARNDHPRASMFSAAPPSRCFASSEPG
jgi:3-deoxy-7-phosphoheptulonate synthase